MALTSAIFSMRDSVIPFIPATFRSFVAMSSAFGGMGFGIYAFQKHRYWNWQVLVKVARLAFERTKIDDGYLTKFQFHTPNEDIERMTVGKEIVGIRGAKPNDNIGMEKEVQTLNCWKNSSILPAENKISMRGHPLKSSLTAENFEEQPPQIAITMQAEGVASEKVRRAQFGS